MTYAASILDRVIRSGEQLYPGTSDSRATLSQSLASGIALQMDQATPAYQKVLRHFRERTEDSNLDRHLGLRARGDCQKIIDPVVEEFRIILHALQI